MILGIFGSTGRTGAQVLTLAQTEFKSVFSKVIAPTRGQSLEPLAKCDVVIDFSTPDALSGFLKLCLPADPAPALVIGTTGLTPAILKDLDTFANTRGPIIAASNFSMGVLALQEILKTAAPLLIKLGYQPEMIEAHHQFKKDAPSGTALTLKSTLGVDLPIHSVRAGGVVGDHHVTFYGPSDRIVIGHSAQDRAIFARGALQAAEWLCSKRRQNPALKGHHPLQDVLK